jgi:hypothetical protein
MKERMAANRAFARACGIAALLAKVIAEVKDEGGIELLDRQVGGRHAEHLVHELEEELKAVRVGITGVRARQLLAREPLRQEGGDVRSDRGHDAAPSRNRSHASATLRMSVGVACRYQQVSATWVCPRYVDKARTWGPTALGLSGAASSARTATVWRKSWMRGPRVPGPLLRPAARDSRRNHFVTVPYGSRPPAGDTNS